MAKKQNKSSSRGKGSRKQQIIALVVVVAIIGVVFLGLEALRKRFVPGPVEKPTPAPHVKMPQRGETTESIQKPHTSARHVAPAKARHKATGPGTVAVIIDDMGSSLQEAKALLAIDQPLTFSIIPGLPKVKGVAEAAHAQGRQVMVHMPMEPQGYPQQRMEKNGLLLSQSDSQIGQQVQEYLRTVPYAVGANNHMGSRFTENGDKMAVVLGVLKEKGLFFIDSRTSPKSVGYALAGKMGLETGTRNVFLDNVQDVAAIKAQLDEGARIARQKGSAIVICHPHPTTIRALKEAMPELARNGITFVLASELVR